MTPLDAALREITLELEALRNRVGNGPMPSSLALHIDFDRETGMPRDVQCAPEWRRRVLGGAVPARLRAR